jgi:PIN domain nuclease of toxin-antitoxin system
VVGGAVIVLDTHAIVFDALVPKRLSPRARKAIEAAAEDHRLACSDISLWEIAMLISRGRLHPAMDARQFLDDVITARSMQVLAITPEIAVLSQSDAFAHGDPADRLIAATAQSFRASLVTSDERLRALKEIATIW